MRSSLKIISIILVLTLSPLDALIIRAPRALSISPARELMTRRHHRKAHHGKRRLQYDNYGFSDEDTYGPVHTSGGSMIQNSLHWADFFIVIVAVFIGVLIANFVKNLFGGGQSEKPKRRANEDLFKYSVPADMFRARKLSDGRRLRAVNKKITAGEGKLANYINGVLLSKHHVRIPKRKLFVELGKVKHYFDASGLSMPEQLTERGLYQITKNVFWNLHHFNMESKHALAAKTISTLYGHRQKLLSTFVGSFKGF